MANPIKIVKAVKKATQNSIAQKKNYKEKVTIPAKKVVKAAKKEARANARGLKAANKPLSKGNKKLLKDIGQMANYIAMDRRPTPPSIKKIYETNKNFGPFKAPEQVREGMRAVYAEARKLAKQEKLKNSMVPKKISPAQKALNKKLGR
jgi:hypothetical protein